MPATPRLCSWIDPGVAANSGRSGFRLLATGLDAFVARGLLIELAEKTLDLQYYIFHADQTGSLVVDRLIAAADRGVHVRLLLDDWGTLEKKDEAVAGLDGHPKIEIKLFNPYIHRTRLGRLAELVTMFTRVNRRMHNKQLIADGAAVVLGGRNIGDEYFGLGELDFQDIDVLACGPVARQSTASFEAYWSSPFAVPITDLGKFKRPSPEQFAAAREQLRARCVQLAESPYGNALGGSGFARELRTQELQFHWADARIIADPPEKLYQPAGTRSPTYLGGQISPVAQGTRSELLVVSPYFVPGKNGVAFLTGRRNSGVDVRVLTNSLAATDVWLVHAGYMKYRQPLLAQGVRLFELRPETPIGPASAGKGPLGSSRASLHGKTFVFDRASVFIGSVNLDPRSLEQNTEVGVLVDSPSLTAEVTNLFERWASPARAYEVRRNGRGLEWVGTREGRAVRFDTEPEAGFWRSLGARLCSRLPIESLI
jgi:putative cardiolipin synthase